jgi:hypothetical protein
VNIHHPEWRAKKTPTNVVPLVGVSVGVFPPTQPQKSVATPEGFEPPTPGSEDQCSNPLSYGAVGITAYGIFRNQEPQKIRENRMSNITGFS